MKTQEMQYTRQGGWTGPLGELDSESTLVLVFGGRDYLDAHDAIDELVAAYPNSSVVGCSTSGEIAGRRMLQDALSVMTLAFEASTVRVASATTDEGCDSRARGEAIAGALSAPDLAAILVISNGVHVNGTQLVAGMNDALPEGVVVTGGLAGDDAEFSRTWVLHEGEVSLDTTVAVGIYGDAITVSHGSQGGWKSFGATRTITASEANVLHEIDGEPALDLYKKYLGDQAEGLPGTALLFPLEIYHPEAPERRLVRTILGIDEETKSMTFAGDMPVGWYAGLMMSNVDQLVDGAEQAAEIAARAEHAPGAACIAVSCVGRRLVLDEHVDEELEAVADLLPEGTALAGFYSYGELSPHEQGQRCDLHNQTMTLTLLSERASAGE